MKSLLKSGLKNLKMTFVVSSWIKATARISSILAVCLAFNAHGAEAGLDQNLDKNLDQFVLFTKQNTSDRAILLSEAKSLIGDLNATQLMALERNLCFTGSQFKLWGLGTPEYKFCRDDMRTALIAARSPKLNVQPRVIAPAAIHPSASKKVKHMKVSDLEFDKEGDVLRPTANMKPSTSQSSGEPAAISRGYVSGAEEGQRIPERAQLPLGGAQVLGVRELLINRDATLAGKGANGRGILASKPNELPEVVLGSTVEDGALSPSCRSQNKVNVRINLDRNNHGKSNYYTDYYVTCTKSCDGDNLYYVERRGVDFAQRRKPGQGGSPQLSLGRLIRMSASTRIDEKLIEKVFPSGPSGWEPSYPRVGALMECQVRAMDNVTEAANFVHSNIKNQFACAMAPKSESEIATNVATVQTQSKLYELDLKIPTAGNTGTVGCQSKYQELITVTELAIEPRKPTGAESQVASAE